MCSSLNVKYTDALAFVAGSWLVYKIWRRVRAGAGTTKLPGPPSSNWLFGVTKEVNDGDMGAMFENWAKEYGDVFQIPGPFGERKTVILDPKAIAYFFSKNQFTYIRSKFVKRLLEKLVNFHRILFTKS